MALTAVLLGSSNIALADSKSEIMLDPMTAENTSQKELHDADIDKPRGQLLYETHCDACHTDSVHSRDPRKATDIGKIKYFVTRWSNELKLNWSEKDIEAVTRYVNSRYYKFK